MAGPIKPTQVPQHIKSVLSGLRRRIRIYVLLEGLGVLAIWISLVFWLAFLFDYVPVRLLGADELSRNTRVTFLVMTGAISLWLIYRFWLRRLFARLSDRSMAIVLERRHPEFRDGLVTVVELNQNPESANNYSEAMLESTSSAASAHVDAVNAGNALRWGRLALLVPVFLVLGSPIGIWHLLDQSDSPVVATIFRRFLKLEDVLWPRQSAITIVGVQVHRKSATGVMNQEAIIPFKDKRIKVPQGSDLTLIVHANADEKEVPRLCTIFYDSQETRGRRNMRKVGGPEEGVQQFTFADKPFEGIFETIEFDIQGNDHWQRGYTIEVVPNPVIRSVALDYDFPSYIDRTPVRDFGYTRGMPLQRGSKLSIRCTSNKSLKQAFLFHVDQGQQYDVRFTSIKGEKGTLPVTFTIPQVKDDDGNWLPLDVKEPVSWSAASGEKPKLVMQDGELMEVIDGQPSSFGRDFPVKVELASGGRIDAILNSSDAEFLTFGYNLERLDQDLMLDVTTIDTDNVPMEETYRIAIGVTPDNPPRVQSVLYGIGTMITDKADVPVRGKIEDDWGVHETWLHIHVAGQENPVLSPFKLKNGEDIETNFDFRTSKQNGGITLKPTDKLVMTVRATDKCDLDGAPNSGQGTSFELEVVTEDELLAALERRELSIRRNYVKIISETEDLRDSLARIEEGLRLGTAEVKNGQEELSPEEAARDLHGFRVRLVQGAQATSSTAALEVGNVAQAFRDIALELANNRLDTEERKRRLSNEIADPLQQIADLMFPNLDRTLRELQTNLKTDQAAPTAKVAFEQTGEILAEMDAILKKMVEIEDFNELLNLIRSLIEEQENVLRDTENEQKRILLEFAK